MVVSQVQLFARSLRLRPLRLMVLQFFNRKYAKIRGDGISAAELEFSAAE